MTPLNSQSNPPILSNSSYVKLLIWILYAVSGGEVNIKLMVDFYVYLL
jgi:hypothetical protein